MHCMSMLTDSNKEWLFKQGTIVGGMLSVLSAHFFTAVCAFKGTRVKAVYKIYITVWIYSPSNLGRIPLQTLSTLNAIFQVICTGVG